MDAEEGARYGGLPLCTPTACRRGATSGRSGSSSRSAVRRAVPRAQAVVVSAPKRLPRPGCWASSKDRESSRFDPGSAAVRSALLMQATKEEPMEQYAILRRRGWRTAEELEQAAARSTQVGDKQMSDDIRWIRSYVIGEGTTALGTVCIYE